MYLGIDPGLSTGWAVLDATGGLVSCGRGEAFPCLSNRQAVIEKPQVYQRQKKRVDPNNLITLAIRVGRYQERLEAAGVRVELVLPTTWKGQIDKERHHLRVHAALNEHERTLVEKFGKAGDDSRVDDVWDAVALAKWAFAFKKFGNVANLSR